MDSGGVATKPEDPAPLTSKRRTGSFARRSMSAAGCWLAPKRCYGALGRTTNGPITTNVCAPGVVSLTVLAYCVWRLKTTD